MNAEDRHRAVLGDGPRVLPLAPQEMTGHAIAIHERIRAVVDRQEGPTTLETIPAFNATLMKHPQLFEKHIEFGLKLLLGGTLGARIRELAILRIAWLCQAPYEFGEHVLIARAFGVDSDQVEAIIAGSGDPSWTGFEAAILRAVEELFEGALVSDSTWAELGAELTEQQLIELLILIGHYQTMAYLLNSLGMQLQDVNEGLMAR